MRKLCQVIFLGCAIIGLTTGRANATPFHLLLETNADAGSGQEVYVANFNSFANVLSATASSNGFSVLDIQSTFMIRALTYDGAYRLLLETRADAGSGAEVYLVTFNTLADLMAGNAASNGFSVLDIQPGYHIGGLAYDSAYRLLLETNADAGGGAEIYLATFNTFADLLSATAASNGFSVLDIQPTFSVGGLTYDGAFRLLLETNADAGSGAEIYLATFNTFADLLSANAASNGFSVLDIQAPFSVRGFAAETQAPSAVPEPGTLGTLSLALAGLARWRRKRRT